MARTRSPAGRARARRTYRGKGARVHDRARQHAAQALYESMGWQRDEVFLPYTLYFSEEFSALIRRGAQDELAQALGVGSR